MDVQAILGGMFPLVPSNGTATMGNSSAGSQGLHIVETVLPLIGLRGFAPIYRFAESALGRDPSYLLAVLGFGWAFNKLFQQIYAFYDRILVKYLMSTIHISSTDEIYLHVMAWLAKQISLVNSRSITAETVWKTAWEEEDISTMGRDNSGLYLNFSNQEARTRPKYVPSVGHHSFWWNGQYFRLQRKKESLFDDRHGFGTFKDKEDLMISCIWRNPDPIKKLLAHAKQQYYKQHEARTTVKRPVSVQFRRSRNNWQVVASRPVRDMRTVILDQHQKNTVLADMNEYLHPATPRWYANRGIPLRRGYLFHGPPGTGKTSLSFALAGVFGLDIYVISLLEPTLTEEDLGSLFTSLPRRCIVLLEDIDTAGLRRTGEEKPAIEEKPAVAAAGEKESSNSTSDGDANKATTSLDIKELAKALKKESEDQKKGISLSGLLNAIDGVASHEGRVLIMTTNIPESLDPALIRPGRVDLQVPFTNATKEQARELFIRMYEVDEGRPRTEGLPSPTSPSSSPSSSGSTTPSHEKTTTTTTTTPELLQLTNGNGNSNGHIPSSSSSPSSSPSSAETTLPGALRSGDLDIAVSELPEYARKFGDKIPAGEFSPAEIQGYLLKRKKTPRRAVEEAGKWVAALLQQKANKSKIVQVQ